LGPFWGQLPPLRDFEFLWLVAVMILSFWAEAFKKMAAMFDEDVLIGRR
jgi:hypothetical protein